MLQTGHPTSTPESAPARAAAGTPWLWIGALALLLAALALRQLALFNHDEPPLALLARDAQQAFGGLLTGEASEGRASMLHHDAGERLWKHAWFTRNGQLDHRLSSVTTIVLQCGAFAALLAALAGALRTRWVVTLGLMVATTVFAPVMTDVCPPAGSAGISGAVLWSLLHLLLMTRARPLSGTWWLGLGMGAIAIGWATTGVASAVALAVWGMRAGGRALHLANAILAALGLVLAFVRSGGLNEGGVFAHGALAVVLWAPTMVCLWRWIRTRPAGSRLDAVALLALWGALDAGIVALTGAPTGEFLLVALAINAACIVVLWPETTPQAAINLILAGAWAIVVGDAMFHAKAPEGTSAASATAILQRPELRGVLPMSLRAPLALGAAETAFAAGRAPELPGLGGLPFAGTWTSEGGARTGEFVSAPLSSAFPILQIRVAGTLRPPGTTIVLRTADGKEIAPLEPTFAATERWKRVNFATPAGSFQLVARDHSATDWLAFTPPIEIGRGSRLAGKIPGAWPLALGCGLLLAAGAVVSSRRRGTAEPLAIDLATTWQVTPWLALFAYLLFFSHHVDVTAGPNDSGGYLNSAQLLTEGRLMAPPRIPAGMEIDRDTTLYVPITFHAKGDRVVPEYPVGFPLEVAAMAQLFPFERAVYVLMLLQLGLGVLFTQKLARAFGLEASWAWLAGGIVGLSPVYLFQALQPQSDGPALVWVTAAVYWAWTGREKPSRAILAGLATALAVLLRPSNVLCVFPILACLVDRGGLRRLIVLGLAGLPAGLWLLWYQHTLYGSWHTTGYGDISTGFGLRFIEPTLRSYVIWLPEMFTPLVCLALAAPFVRTIEVRARAVLTIWVGAFIVFYAVYWCTWDNWYNMRFVMPAAPAALVLAMLVARDLLRRVESRFAISAGNWRKPALGIVAAAVLLGFLAKRSADRDVLYWLHNNHEHAYAARWVQERLPANAVVFAKHATGSLMHYTNLPFIRSDHEKARESTKLYEQLERAGRPIYALNYHWETAGYVWGKGRGSGYPDLPGTWERVALMWDDDVMVWKRRATEVRGQVGAGR